MIGVVGKIFNGLILGKKQKEVVENNKKRVKHHKKFKIKLTLLNFRITFFSVAHQ